MPGNLSFQALSDAGFDVLILSNPLFQVPGGLEEHHEVVQLLEPIPIRGVGRSLVVRHDEVDWLEAVGSYVRVHAGETHRLIRASLTELIRSLDPASFFRIHRSSIVNLERIREIEAIGHGDALIRLVDGTELRVSRSRREAFEQALEG